MILFFNKKKEFFIVGKDQMDFWEVLRWRAGIKAVGYIPVENTQDFVVVHTK